MAVPLLAMRGISKGFSGVKALGDMDFFVNAGEIHALMGENGAGKSTLLKVLTGVYPLDSGSMELEGKPIAAGSPAESQELGVSMVYQEVNLIPHLSVAENICLGRQPKRLGMVRRGAMRRRAAAALARLGLALDVNRTVAGYSIAIQQMVAIARALDINARLLVLDEPTSSLDEDEVKRLYAVMRKLRADGLGIVFVTHFLDQVYEVCDQITVLRNGLLVGQYATVALSRRELVGLMLGKEQEAMDSVEAEKNAVQQQRGGANAASDSASKPSLLTAKNIGRPRSVTGMNFMIHPGETLGLAGLLGSGRTETARLVFGIDPATQGNWQTGGRDAKLRSPRQAIRHGFGFCSEDRKTEGIIPGLSVRGNIALALQGKMGWYRRLSSRAQKELADTYIRALNIATPNAEKPVSQLSGGNQQKVLLARWLAANPRLLILDEPTRGIDIGAKAEIETLVRKLCEEGMAVLFISSELEEVVRVSDRVAVLRDRRKIADLEGKAVNEREILRLVAEGDAA